MASALRGLHHLDGATDRLPELNLGPPIVVVHAHGDNIPLLNNWVPRFPGLLVATTQAAPLPHVHNFGGVHGCDPAAFAADELGGLLRHPCRLRSPDRNVDPLKQGKFYMARKLLALIGIRV